MKRLIIVAALAFVSALSHADTISTKASGSAESEKGVALFQNERIFYQGQKEVRGIVSSGSATVTISDEDE